MKSISFRITLLLVCAWVLCATMLYLYHSVYRSLGESKEAAMLAGNTAPLTLNVEKFERILKIIVAKQALTGKEHISDPFLNQE